MKEKYIIWMVGAAVVLYILYQNGTLGSSSSSSSSDTSNS